MHEERPSAVSALKRQMRSDALRCPQTTQRQKERCMRGTEAYEGRFVGRTRFCCCFQRVFCTSDSRAHTCTGCFLFNLTDQCGADKSSILPSCCLKKSAAGPRKRLHQLLLGKFKINSSKVKFTAVDLKHTSLFLFVDKTSSWHEEKHI